VDADQVGVALQEHRLHKLVVLPVVLPLFLREHGFGRVDQRMKGVKNVVEDAPETPVQVLLREVVGMANPIDYELVTSHKLSPFPCTSRSIEDGYKRVKLNY
jgi:hypothetical protein